ncbi:3-hydroxyacyl-CoA dehydrogenase NAD-binding domain-containing protein [Azospirillum picis]|uniref:3-hydroxyacyl-CoA dehydrogenase n=1 Tax=Azospirillum picis TaxID=488438 RepID=A0ABU0MHS1_9PROT|nr:3-hydroxyacyl-CoA dehydrogenase NAD-binding domain-containing protein [Azospirillum picis]MBP2299389.1 3-hydroxyacyl-CoA dehydrogenase [Azospirillum picis]MDQ0532973.1 3-hydroxyacyl-CoA dehydrogenase [Azospirillum picis]
MASPAPTDAAGGLPVTYERHGRIGVITVDHPPVNAVSQGVRGGLVAALDEGLADLAAEALLLVCAGRTFMAGADIREFGKAPAPPTLPEVVAWLDAAGKPVTAAIHGTALGGGLEIALACHFRVALPGARLGLPEVKLGLLPGAGGTQRLPRLVGPEKALDMILSGDPVGAEEALAIGLVDAVEDADTPLEAGLRAAERLLDRRRLAGRDVLVPVSARSGRITGTDPALFARRRAELAAKTPHLFSPHRIVDAVEAAVTLPFADGTARERALFLECMASPQRAGLIHAFFAEREVAKVPGLPTEAPLRTIGRTAVVGAGTMGTGIAMCFANAGLPVLLQDSSTDALARATATIRRNYETTARKGRLTMEQVEGRMALIRPTPSLDDVAGADLVVEAAFESMDVKRAVFRSLDAICKPGAILATNTSTLDIDAIAQATTRPDDVLGLHFFSPAQVMRLLEVVRGAGTSDTVLATAMALARKIGKVGVAVGNCHGFVGNRILHQRGCEAMALVGEGASPQQVDRVLTEFGFPLGHFAMTDLAGLDVGWRIRQERRKAGDPEAEAPDWLDVLAERGRHGQKTGAGVYRYEAGSRVPLPDPEVDSVIAEDRRRRGITPRIVADEDVRERCLYVMVNEAAKILDEGVAARPVDIDAIWLHGYGFPSWRGGLLFWAGQEGLRRIAAAVERHARRTGSPRWQPSPRLLRWAEAGSIPG